jgi:hypothetical protein
MLDRTRVGIYESVMGHAVNPLKRPASRSCIMRQLDGPAFTGSAARARTKLRSDGERPSRDLLARSPPPTAGKSIWLWTSVPDPPRIFSRPTGCAAGHQTNLLPPMHSSSTRRHANGMLNQSAFNSNMPMSMVVSEILTV